MIYVETALEQLRNSFDELGLVYNIDKLDENSVQLGVVKNSVEIKVWFNADKQIFGFDMLQGGCKTYTEFSEFEKFFNTYLTIHTEFLPSAKAVADEFEKVLGASSIYDNFQGNNKQGYVAQFRLLGQDDKIILISRVPEGYVAKLGSYVDDGSRFKVLSEYKYEVDEVNNVSLIPTIHSYMAELSRRYSEDDSISIERIGVDEFYFNIEGLSIKVKVEFIYKEIRYLVESINNYNVDFSCTLDDDPYKLSSLYMICKDKYDDLSCESEEINCQNVTEQSVDSIDKSEQELENTYADNSSKELETVSTEDSDEICMNTKSDEDKLQEISEVNMEFSIKTIIGSDNTVRSLQFITADGIYIMSLDKAKELGIPVERIDEHATYMNKHGIVVTEDEVNKHCFSKDISDNADLCRQLFNSIFE